MRFALYFLCKGFNATTIWIVEQFGFAIILSFFVNISALISGTINGFAGSILQALELSITVIPASANFGAHSNEVLPPAEKIATAGFAAIPSVMLTTLYLSLIHISEPTRLLSISYAVFCLK